MKKYLFGMLAIVLAIGFSAFTKPAKSTNPRFRYDAPNGSYLVADVIDESNWIPLTGDLTCNLDLKKACVIEVSSNDVVGGVLQSSADIHAAFETPSGHSNTAIVVTGGNVIDIFNTQE